jgi:hypothetical protein
VAGLKLQIAHFLYLKPFIPVLLTRFYRLDIICAFQVVAHFAEMASKAIAVTVRRGGGRDLHLYASPHEHVASLKARYLRASPQ